MSNTRIIEALKLTDKIDIIIEKDQQIPEKLFSSNFKVDNKDKNSEPNSISNTLFAPATT